MNEEQQQALRDMWRTLDLIGSTIPPSGMMHARLRDAIRHAAEARDKWTRANGCEPNGSNEPPPMRLAQ